VSQPEARRSGPSGWVVGGVTFAAVMMFTIGIFQLLAGISAIVKDDFYVIAPNYAFNLDVSGWGWIHLIIGIVLLFGGWALIAGKTWAVVLAIALAVMSAIANFFYIPYYPWWSLLIIALDVWVIWALTRPTARET
jgi:hypothetical protein